MAIPTFEGQLFTRTSWSNTHAQTLLACGRHYNDSITGEPLDEPVYVFIVFDGGTVFRARLTEAECSALTRSTKPLTQRQMATLAALSFNHWEQNEYRRCGTIA